MTKDIIEFIKGGKELSKDKFAAVKIVSIIEKLILVIFILIYLLNNWNIYLSFNTPVPPLFAKNVRLFINSYVYWIVGSIVVIHFAIQLLSRYVVSIPSNKNLDLFPFWKTCEEMFRLLGFLGILLFLLNALIEMLNGINIFNNVFLSVSIAIAVWFSVKLFCWLYKKNMQIYSKSIINYTDFFDSDSKRICYGDYVIFNQRLYQIKFHANEKVLYLVLPGLGRIKYELTLEEAVKDKSGNLKIFRKE